MNGIHLASYFIEKGKNTHKTEHISNKYTKKGPHNAKIYIYIYILLRILKKHHKVWTQFSKCNGT